MDRRKQGTATLYYKITVFVLAAIPMLLIPSLAAPQRLGPVPERGPETRPGSDRLRHIEGIGPHPYEPRGEPSTHEGILSVYSMS